MKVAVLTSSRADFGIYLPLLHQLENDSFFELEVLAFGTHLSSKHGSTLNEINKYNFSTVHNINTIEEGDTPFHVSKSMGNTFHAFAAFWSKNTYDLVFALGDRYEMFAAVASSSPFNLKIAHLHGGETTLGAIDNAFRHSISHFAALHFVSTVEYKNKLIHMVDKPDNVHVVGAMSIENLKSIALFTKEEFNAEFSIDLNTPTILSTFHPETVSYANNITHINELLNSFKDLLKEYQVVITMPNADTMGNVIREKILAFKEVHKNLIIIESFGMKGYLSCMKYCSFMLGNTSSGFVEASFFPTQVINLGTRQNGRIRTNNILDCVIEKNAILNAVETIKSTPTLEPINIYGDGTTSTKIIHTLKCSI